MTIASVQEYTTTTSTLQTTKSRRKNKLNHFLQANVYKHVVLLAFTALLLFSSVVLSNSQPAAQAANPGAGNACSWYRVHWDDTLTGIAWRYRSNIWTLARVNYIRNVNLIFVGQELCIPYRSSGGSGSGNGGGRGLQSNGVVRWYDYAALDWSSRGQVTSMLRTAAHNYGLPTNLLLAIAWQESGWYQHVIARDGGIGVMQIQPDTVTWLNQTYGTNYDPHQLQANINLGINMLQWLYNYYIPYCNQGMPAGQTCTWDTVWPGATDGATVRQIVISSYNQGVGTTALYGIQNWSYVNNVMALRAQFLAAEAGG